MLISIARIGLISLAKFCTTVHIKFKCGSNYNSGSPPGRRIVTFVRAGDINGVNGKFNVYLLLDSHGTECVKG